MFSFQTSDELVLEIPSIPCQQDRIHEDLFMDMNSIIASLEANNPAPIHNFTVKLPRISSTRNTNNITNQAAAAASAGNKKKKKIKRKLLHETNDGDDAVDDPINQLKRKMHRDVERQRRQEMSNLYSSLRSLLPHESIKGKRSISDHMHEAVNYITQMQKRIKELQTRRDELKKIMSNDSSTTESGGTGTNGCRNSSVTVSACKDGVEILIRIGSIDKVFPLSKVLQEIEGRGFNVVSCNSTIANGQNFLYIIQSEVNEPSCIDLSGLQQRLIDVIRLQSDS